MGWLKQGESGRSIIGRLACVVAGAFTLVAGTIHAQDLYSVFSNAGIQFGSQADWHSDPAVTSLDNGRVIQRQLTLPPIGDNAQVTAQLHIKAHNDPWDRAGSVQLVTPDGPVELHKFVTGFGGTTSHQQDITALVPYLRQGPVTISVFIDTWVEQAWTVDFGLTIDDDAPAPAPSWNRAIFNDQDWRAGEFPGNRRSHTVVVPAGMEKVVLNYLSTGHTSDGVAGDEFNQRRHRIYIDGVKVFDEVPWRTDGIHFRDVNPTSGRSGEVWSSDLPRSGWVPGDDVDPYSFDVSRYMTPGRHIVEFEIEGIQPDDGQRYGYWRTSSYLAGYDDAPDQRAKSPLIQQLDDGLTQTVVVYGTSLTAGGAWVNQLSSALDTQYPGQITWVNAALSGKASASGLANLDSRVLAHEPDAVFIEFAINDAFTDYPPGDIDEDLSVEQARENLGDMIGKIKQQHAGAQIVLQTMNPSWDAPNGNQSGTKRPNLATYYQMYRDVATEQGVRLVDNFPVWQTLQSNQPSEFAQRVADGTHPDATAYDRYVTPALLHDLGADNRLVLLVDVQTGRTVAHNQSDTPIEIIGYTISSSAAALLTSWGSMADQQKAGWYEANPSASHLSELNPTGSVALAVDQKLDLGFAWSTSGALDLTFSYQTLDGALHKGLVVYTSAVAELLSVAGDYNGDGILDLADYTVWRDTLGSTVPTGSGADGNRNGIVDSKDYEIWKTNFATQPSATTERGLMDSQVVPEPTACVLAIAALVGLPITVSKKTLRPAR